MISRAEAEARYSEARTTVEAARFIMRAVAALYTDPKTQYENVEAADIAVACAADALEDADRKLKAALEAINKLNNG